MNTETFFNDHAGAGLYSSINRLGGAVIYSSINRLGAGAPVDARPPQTLT
jgi:hypothetical protein